MISPMEFEVKKETGNIFNVRFINGDEETFLTIADLQNISDLESGIILKDPKLKFTDLTIYYCDKNNHKIQIANSRDFATFLAQHHDRNIYVTCGNVNKLKNSSLALSTSKDSEDSWIILGSGTGSDSGSPVSLPSLESPYPDSLPDLVPCTETEASTSSDSSFELNFSTRLRSSTRLDSNIDSDANMEFQCSLITSDSCTGFDSSSSSCRNFSIRSGVSRRCDAFTLFDLGKKVVLIFFISLGLIMLTALSALIVTTLVTNISGFLDQRWQSKLIENHFEEWPKYNKIILEFCRKHPSEEACKNIISEFLSLFEYAAHTKN